MSFIAPRVLVRAYRPGTTRPLDIPGESFKAIQSRRGEDGASMSLEVPRSGPGTMATVAVTGGEGSREAISLEAALPDQTVVDLLVARRRGESLRRLNRCYVAKWKRSMTADGNSVFRPDLRGLDSKIREQKIFLDIAHKDEQDTNRKSQTGKTFEKAFSAWAETVKEIKDLRLLLQSIWDDIVVDLVQSSLLSNLQFSYAGQPLVARAGETSGGLLTFQVFSDTPYTTDFISILHNLTQLRLGESVSFFQFLEAYATPPLYQLLYDPMEGDGEADGASTYSVKESAALVFRKMPYDTWFNKQGWNVAGRNQEGLHGARNIKVLRDLSDLHVETADQVSGIHVAPAIFNNMTSALVVPVIWNDQLRARYGHKVLQVKLDGVGFPPDPDSGKRQELRQAIQEIQKTLYAIFCGGPNGDLPIRSTMGSGKSTFDFFRPGHPIILGNKVPGAGVDFGREALLTNVTDTFDPGNGIAESALSFKWLDRYDVIPPARRSVRG